MPQRVAYGKEVKKRVTVLVTNIFMASAGTSSPFHFFIEAAIPAFDTLRFLLILNATLSVIMTLDEKS